MLQVHAIKQFGSFLNADITMTACGRSSFHRVRDYKGRLTPHSFWSPTGKTQFQAVDPDDTRDTTPRVSCRACLKHLA